MRKKLIEAILDLSGDEMQDSDLIEIASEETEQLIDRLISIAEWYRENQ